MSLSVWSNRHRPNAPATHPIMQTRRRVLGKPCLESWATWGFSSPDSKSKEPNDCATNRGQQQGSVNNSQRVKGVKGVKGVKPYICIILFIRPCLFALEGLCSKCSGFLQWPVAGHEGGAAFIPAHDHFKKRLAGAGSEKMPGRSPKKPLRIG
jgi:hypothetical protein